MQQPTLRASSAQILCSIQASWIAASIVSALVARSRTSRNFRRRSASEAFKIWAVFITILHPLIGKRTEEYRTISPTCQGQFIRCRKESLRTGDRPAGRLCDRACAGGAGLAYGRPFLSGPVGGPGRASGAVGASWGFSGGTGGPLAGPPSRRSLPRPDIFLRLARHPPNSNLAYIEQFIRRNPTNQAKSRD